MNEDEEKEGKDEWERGTHVQILLTSAKLILFSCQPEFIPGVSVCKSKILAHRCATSVCFARPVILHYWFLKNVGFYSSFTVVYHSMGCPTWDGTRRRSTPHFTSHTMFCVRVIIVLVTIWRENIFRYTLHSKTSFMPFVRYWDNYLWFKDWIIKNQESKTLWPRPYSQIGGCQEVPSQL